MASSWKAPAAEQPGEAAAGDFDPIYEWLDDGGSYLLRLSLPGFKKEDFRVHVDAGGRLTVISQGAGRLHKAFQLPNTANLDAITGRFDGAVLTLTVPKLRQPADAAVAPPPAQQAKEEEAAGEPKDLQQEKTAAPKKAGHAEAETEGKIKADISASLKATQAKEEEDKRKAEATREKANAARRDQDEKARAAEHRASVEREAARRIEAARAKVAEAKAAAEGTGGQWKERAAAEGLKLAETIGKNKEVVAAAVAAFTLGAFLSRRLFSRS
ncbi:hypothetical protein EJB05_16117, partial [Eragrostis curvula]